QRGDLGRMPFAQVLVRAALDDAEEVRAAGGLLAAQGPARGALERFDMVRPRALRGRALIEGHEDVGGELQLDLDRFLGSQLVPAAVEVALEDRALFADLPLLRQRKHLKSA